MGIVLPGLPWLLSKLDMLCLGTSARVVRCSAMLTSLTIAGGWCVNTVQWQVRLCQIILVGPCIAAAASLKWWPWVSAHAHKLT